MTETAMANDGYPTFVEAARTVTAPGYQVVPFDEELTNFEEGGAILAEAEDSMTPEEFDEYCRNTGWVGGNASLVRPLLSIWRAKNAPDYDVRGSVV